MAIFTNQATLTYQNTTTSSNIATGELLEVLSATKTAVTETYTTGSDVTYVISILNSGTAPIGGITVADDLGAYPFGGTTLVPLDYKEGSVRLFVNGVLQTPPTVTQGTGVTFSGITIPAGGNAILLYEAVANSTAPLGIGANVTNTATVTAGALSAVATATETVTPQAGASLTITKAITPRVVTEGSRVTYSFVIQNSGNTEAVASDNVSVSDLFDPILSDLTVTLNGAPLAAGTGYTYDQAGGQFATVPGVITVPAATFSQSPDSGIWITNPGTATLTVEGTI